MRYIGSFTIDQEQPGEKNHIVRFIVCAEAKNGEEAADQFRQYVHVHVHVRVHGQPLKDK